MRKLLPEFIKPLIRFVYYKNERRKVFREIKIRKQQNQLFKTLYSKSTEKLIVFLVDGANWFTGHDNISGGILSIASIYEETEKLKHIHGAEIIMVTQPNAHLLLQHSQFPNNITVFRFKQLKKLTHTKNILFHIPEYLFKTELIRNIQEHYPYLTTESIHLNILNQRIDIMPDPMVIQSIKQQGYSITQTTAHEQYSTTEVRTKFGIPLHKLSVYATPERYNFITHDKKENLILVSPDKGQLKERVLAKIKQELPHFRIEIISGITYMHYLSLIEKAKYMITFGEGLDFYFIETVFSGGVSFAVYNEEFFTPHFKSLLGVYEGYEQMASNITSSIKTMETNFDLYKTTNQQQFNECHKIYGGDKYQQNLINFYQKNYLLP